MYCAKEGAYIREAFFTAGSFKIFMKDAGIYTAILNVMITLLKNSGVLLCMISLLFLLLLSLFGHFIDNNFISYFSIIVIVLNVLYILYRDSAYNFVNTNSVNFLWFKVPELDMFALCAMIPLLCLYIVNVCKRR